MGRGGYEEVDVVGIGHDEATVTNEGGDGTEGRVQAEGEELGSQRVTLTCATPREDDLGRAGLASHVKLGGVAVSRKRPTPKARESLGHHLHEGLPIDRVERITHIECNVNPIRVLLKDGGDCVGHELHTGATRDANLGGPRGAVRLGGARSPGLLSELFSTSYMDLSNIRVFDTTDY